MLNNSISPLALFVHQLSPCLLYPLYHLFLNPSVFKDTRLKCHLCDIWHLLGKTIPFSFAVCLYVCVKPTLLNRRWVTSLCNSFNECVCACTLAWAPSLPLCSTHSRRICWHKIWFTLPTAFSLIHFSSLPSPSLGWIIGGESKRPIAQFILNVHVCRWWLNYLICPFTSLIQSKNVWAPKCITYTTLVFLNFFINALTLIQMSTCKLQLHCES